MRALARLAWGEGVPDCTRCTRDPQVYEEFGCGREPAAAPMYSVTCSACAGRGCERCDDGEVGFRRCPNKLTEHMPTVRLAFNMFAHYMESGVLPSAGGLADQSASLVEAFEAARSEKNKIERERADKEALDAKRRDKIANKRGVIRG